MKSKTKYKVGDCVVCINNPTTKQETDINKPHNAGNGTYEGAGWYREGTGNYFEGPAFYEDSYPEWGTGSEAGP